MTLNRTLILLVVIGYVIVNLTMQIDFFAGRDIFAKYQPSATPAEASVIASKAYCAKTAFLLILLVLMTCRMRFELSFGLSFLIYALTMLVFFGIGRSTILYSAASLALLASYFWTNRRTVSSAARVS